MDSNLLKSLCPTPTPAKPISEQEALESIANLYEEEVATRCMFEREAETYKARVAELVKKVEELHATIRNLRNRMDDQQHENNRLWLQVAALLTCEKASNIPRSGS